MQQFQKNSCWLYVHWIHQMLNVQKLITSSFWPHAVGIAVHLISLGNWGLFFTLNVDTFCTNFHQRFGNVNSPGGDDQGEGV